jgi:hypothetical protein
MPRTASIDFDAAFKVRFGERIARFRNVLNWRLGLAISRFVSRRLG